uniref:coiled-coil domain-containing protein 187 n=1 Tax=Nyctereutes procyonoides TaxID=34880 RepID=UPI002444FCE5|nr:coiled-coil domain-containing protein 187 [Nyctereutes procyonoides]
MGPGSPRAAAAHSPARAALRRSPSAGTVSPSVGGQPPSVIRCLPAILLSSPNCPLLLQAGGCSCLQCGLAGQSQLWAKVALLDAWICAKQCPGAEELLPPYHFWGSCKELISSGEQLVETLGVLQQMQPGRCLGQDSSGVGTEQWAVGAAATGSSALGGGVRLPMAPAGALSLSDKGYYAVTGHPAFSPTLLKGSWESGLCPPVSEDEAMAALRWPRPSHQPGDLRGATHVAWSDYIEQPGPQGKACSYPVWSEADEAKDGDSSVSSGRLSGSSGGHESCTSPPGPWKEKPPKVLGPWRPARESNPRLEQLRDRIRAQAQWQASCTSLGTSTRSSTSRLCGAPKADPQRKARKLTTPSAAPWDTLKLRSSAKGLGTLSVALCGVEDKAIPGRGREPSGIPQRQASVPREKAKRMKSSPCKREKALIAPTPRRAAKDKGETLQRVHCLPALRGLGALTQQCLWADHVLGESDEYMEMVVGLRPQMNFYFRCRIPFAMEPHQRTRPNTFLRLGWVRQLAVELASLSPQDSELVGIHTWRKGPALVRALLGPPLALPRLQSKPSRDQAPTAELGDNRKVGAAKSSPVRPRMPSPAFLRGDLQVSANAPSLASYDQPVTIQNALAVLRDLRQQIQTGLELAQSRHPRAGPELGRSKLWLQNLAGRKQQGPWSISDVRGPFSKSPQAGMEGKHSSLERAGCFPSGHHRNTLAGWESYPQKTGTAQGWNLSFQRGFTPGSPPERLTSFPRRPWSASAGQASRLQRTGEAQGWNPSFLRSGSPPERLTSFRQRPWSASAGQTSRPQGTWTAYEDWDTPARRPLSPLAQRAWSASFMQSTGTSGKGRRPLLPPSGVKRGWPRKEKEVRVPPPCQKPQGVLGHPYSSEVLREFMHQKSLARRQQAMKEKASAVRALELRNQRLQDVYRKQREAVLSKAVPVVSQTTPGIVTFFPHCAQSRGLEAPGSLGSPVLEWSKVTSGMVLGDQEAPGSFCLCLNRALNRTETLETGGPQDGWEGTPVLMSARSSLGPLKLQDLTTRYPRPGVCIYLDPEESERLGMPGPLHFRYKQARLQALETMANVLKQRIDILTAKLHKSEAPDTVGDPVSDLSSSHPIMVPADPTPADPVCLGALVPNGSREAPWDWTDMRARPLVSPTCFPGGQTLPWSPDWERRQSVSPRGHYNSRPRGFIEDGCLELDNRLARNTASFPALGSFIGSSLGVPAVLDPTCGSLQLEEMPAARGVGSIMPWTMRGCGKGEPADRPWAGWSGGRGATSAGLQSLCPPDDRLGSWYAVARGQCLQHLANIPRKSRGFLKSLQPDLQEQEQALALLRQRAELEVWETQKALDQLLFKHCLQQLMKKHSTQARPDPALEREQPQVCRDLQPRTSPSTVTARPRSHPALSRETAAALQGPQDGLWAQQDKSASAEPRQEVGPDQVSLQLPQARLYARVNPTHQMLELSQREEKLRAQHQAALLRLREKTLEEKMRTELAWLEHQRRCLGSKGSAALLAALAERQQQALSRLEQEQREIRCLQNTHLFSHKERMLLLQHQKDILSLRKAVKHLQQEFQAWTGVPQSSGPGVKPAPMEGSKTSPQSKRPAQGSLCPPTPRGPRNLTSHGLQRSPERPGAQHPAEQRAAVGTPRGPFSNWLACGDMGRHQGFLAQREEHRQVSWSGPIPWGGHSLSRVTAPLCSLPCRLPIGQEDRTPPQATSATDSHRLPPRPVWGVDTLVAGGWPDTGGQLAKSHSPVGQGNPQPNPSSLSSKEETWPLKGSPPQELQGQCSLGRGAPCSPPKTSVVEGSTSPTGSKLGLDFSSSPMEDPHQMESWWLGEQRIEPCWQEDPYNPFPQLEAAPLTAAPAPAPPSLREGSPLGLGPESESKYTPWSCSGSSARSHTASPVKELSCPSLQEFQKVSATLVQLSESSTSLLDWAAGDAPDGEPGRSGEFSPQDTQGLHGGGGQVAWEGLGGTGASALHCSSMEAGGPEPGPGLLQEGQLLPLHCMPSSRSGSELSEASSKVWDEENLLEPGPGADPALGRSSLAGGSSHLESGGVSCSVLPSLDLGKEQEASGTSGSMISGLHAERAKQKSPEAARNPLPSKASSSSDLDLSLSFPSGSLTSEEVDFAKGGEPVLLQASAGRPQEPGNADLSPSNDKKPQEAGSEPKVPVSLRAPPGDPGSLVALTPEGRAPGHSGDGDSPALEEACPTLASRVLPEILSPVDDVLSYSSADLQSSTHRDASLLPPPPTFPAESEASPTSPHSEDFPPPPEDAMFPRGPPEEDASIKTGEVPSLSKKAPPEALSLGSQESGLFLGAGAHSGSFEDKLGGSRSDGGTQAMGSGWSELVGWLGSPSWAGAGDAARQVMLQPPAPSRVSCMAGDGLPVLPVAGGTGLSGTRQRGPCIDPPGAERAEAVDLVSSQLTRRILCDSLAVVSELAQPAAR